MPKEVAQLAGSDFDIDKIFVHRNGGEFTSEGFKPYENNFESFSKYIYKKEKVLNDVLKKFKEEDPEYKEVQKQLAKKLLDKEDIQRNLDYEADDFLDELTKRIERYKDSIDDLVDEGADKQR